MKRVLRSALVFLFGMVLCSFSLPPLRASIVAAAPLKTRGDAFSDFLVREFSPEAMTMILSNDPDDYGNIREVYVDATGCVIGKVRVESLRLRAMGVTLTPPSEWAEKKIDVRQVLNVYAVTKITEKDLNGHLIGRRVGDGDHWRNIRLDITPNGIHAQGNYTYKMLFTMSLLIEVFSKLKIVDKQQIWLDDYSVRINRMDVPQFIVDKAVGAIQPVLDLKKFVFPLRLHSVTYDDEAIFASSRILPEPFDGLSYTYPSAEGTK